jgi:hypothetical protein
VPQTLERETAKSAENLQLGTPIFICGHAKSGTTLLAALLDNHPDIAVFPEESFYTKRYGSRPAKDVPEGAAWMLEDVRRKVEGMENEEVFDRWHFPYFDGFADFKQRFEAILESRRAARGSQTHGDVIEAYVGAFAQATGQSGKKYWLEKTHGNELALHALQEYFPNLKAIYIVRDPRDIYGSWARRMQASGKLDALDRFITRWGLSVWHWQQFAAQNPNSLLVRYEDLLRYPQETLRLICAFLEIPYDSVLETPTKNGNLWEGNSMHADRFQGISTKPIGRWRESLDAAQVGSIEGFLGKAMQTLGYQTSLPPLGARSALREWLRCGKSRALAGMLLRLYWPWALPLRYRLPGGKAS